MKLEKIKLDTDKIRKSKKRIKGNSDISAFYMQLSKDEQNEIYKNRSIAVNNCYKYWDIDYFRLQAVKDVLRVNLCKDIFCENCQHNLSLTRFAKFAPELDRLRKDYDFYHIVWTVPNCHRAELPGTLKKMYSKFVYINEYFKGKKKVKGIDLKRYGYAGAIRSLEITTKTVSGNLEYHPHFHSIFLFAKKLKLDEPKNEVNDYSYSNGRLKRIFSPFEILLQKMWYVFYNDIKLTAENIRTIKQGYSVTVDRAVRRKDYHEVFKYSVKGVVKDKSFDYSVFETLYKALHRRKIIQGYGILNKFKFEEETDEELKKTYTDIRKELEKIEEPCFCINSLSDVIDDMDKHPEIKYISKRKIKSGLNNEK